MNDQGLFIDGNALSPTGWKAVEGKERYSGHIINDILAKCATCEDAAKLFESYNFPALARAKFPIADRNGASIIVEWGQEKLQIVKRTGDYQISTNFVISNFDDPDSKLIICRDFRSWMSLVERKPRIMIRRGGSITVSLLR